MYYRLKDKFMLRGWEKLPYALVNNETKQVLFIKREEFEALNLCDGAIDVDHFLVPEDLRKIIKAAEKNGVVEACLNGETAMPGQEYRKYPARYIKSIHWSVTGKCNYRCKHCYMSAPEAKYGELSHEQCMSIIDQMAECGVMNVSLTGGEALVRRDFMEIVDALLSRGIRITTIYSNGKLVTDELLDELEARAIKPEFNLSFDGVGWHDWLRGMDGAEQAAISAFTRCRDRGFPLGAEMCLHQNNKHTLRDSINLLSSLGVSHLKVNPVSSVGEWVKNKGDYSVNSDELYDIYLDYIPHFFEDGMPMNLMLGGFFYGRQGSPKYFIPARKFSGKPDAQNMCVCGHARLVMYISADGRALPCMALSGMDIQKNFPLVTEAGLARCITDSHYMNMIDTRLKDYLEHNPECAACEHKYLCGGGCRASALEDGDDFLAPDPAFCKIYKGGYIQRITAAADGAIAKYVKNA